MKLSKGPSSSCALLMALACAAAYAVGARAEALHAPPPQDGTAFAARVDGYMRQAGYDYHRVKPNSWYINMKGKELPQIRILVGTGSNSLAVGAVVVPKARLRVTAEAMQKMMKLSYDLNYVRVCIDPDEDLIVLSQARDKWLDQQEFSSTVERVAAAADRAYAEMRPFLGAP
jgi:hypothetical protein